MLMASAAAGDDAAFGEVVETLSGRVQRFLVCAGVPHAEAEELVQETWIRVYRTSGRFMRERSVTAWVFAIARNLMIDRHRRRRAEVTLTEDLAATASQTGRADEARQLWALVRQTVSPQGFDMLWLRYGEGLSTGEIARVLKISPVNVRVQLHRARGQLARVLREGERQ
jgi:RNA polymerase sigma-70 factor (ECF subfamily)